MSPDLIARLRAAANEVIDLREDDQYVGGQELAILALEAADALQEWADDFQVAMASATDWVANEHNSVPPEPPIGTWVRDRYGATTQRQANGKWAPPGMMALAQWEAMYKARGPLSVCGPYGAALEDVRQAERDAEAEREQERNR